MSTPTRKLPATYDDANLLLRLYELRREERMRAARTWFVANYRAASLEEGLKIAPMGSEESVSLRMVTSYWDMAASFVQSGVMNRDLFFESNRELLLVWIRIKPAVPAIREMFGDPFYLHSLEAVGESFAEWLNERAPGSFEGFASRMG
jgi:hypothetical protein